MKPALAMLFALLAVTAAAQSPDLGTEEQRASGEKLYDRYCSQCHGVNGDGEGVAAPYVKPKPRDFTAGKYKIRSTPNGALPTHQDLKEIIRKGMPYSTMPAWPIFNDSQLDALAHYVKTFSEDFADPELVPTPIEIPNPPAITDESIEQGRVIYGELGCAGCHGGIGRADGLSAPTLRDDWGNHLMPVDMTKRWTFRGGPTRKDIFRAFSTGFNGTPMPSYAESLDEDQRWHLVNYITSLGKNDPGYDTMVTATRVAGSIDLERGPEMFENAPPAYFPVVGQIMQPGREFWPSINGIEVRAVYNDSDVAIELRWHDMRAETDGINGPHLVAPVFAEDPHRGGGAGASDDAGDDEGGFWGDEEVEQGEEDFWGEEEAGDDFWGEQEGSGGALSADREFNDAVAIQFPQTLPGGVRKPYFIFGDPQNPVDLWYFDLGTQRPEQFVGRGSELLESQGVADLQAQATYDQGEWTVTFTRPLRSAGGIPLDEGLFVPVAFSVWDGFNRERGNKRGLTQWVYFYLEPGGKVSPVGPMMKAAGLAVMLELLVVVFLRRKYTGDAVIAAPPDMGHIADGTGPA
jgi:mono/diheme cytochrome c family protein